MTLDYLANKYSCFALNNVPSDVVKLFSELYPEIIPPCVTENIADGIPKNIRFSNGKFVSYKGTMYRLREPFGLQEVVDWESCLLEYPTAVDFVPDLEGLI